MKLYSKLLSFKRLPPGTKWMFAEALFTSAWVKLTLKFFPFKKVMEWLGTAQLESDTEPNADTLIIRKQVKDALVLCNKYAFWPTECYTLSLTGKLLLKHRNIKSSLYIGFMKDSAGQYKGHAWLRANDTYLSGYAEAKDFTVHSIFS